MTSSNPGGAGGRDSLATLVERFKAYERGGAAAPGHADHWLRAELLDELQDAVGLAGKMVTERDILRRAEERLARA